MILHTVNKSPFNSNCFSECLEFCTSPCSVLLLEDGAYAATTGCQTAITIEQRNDIHFYVLAADIEARGLSGQLCGAITVVDDLGFVELCCSHQTVQSWY